MITLFQLLLWSLFAFLKMVIWYHFSENGRLRVGSQLVAFEAGHLVLQRDIYSCSIYIADLAKKKKAWCMVTVHLLLHQGVQFRNIKIGKNK